jgi:hypothetical protein
MRKPRLPKRRVVRPASQKLQQEAVEKHSYEKEEEDRFYYQTEHRKREICIIRLPLRKR